MLSQQKVLSPDISLQITIPNEFEKLCPINVGYTAGIETNKVAPVWLQKGNLMDKILVVSTHAKNTYERTVAQAKKVDTGEVIDYMLETPIDVVWESTPRPNPEEIVGLNLDYDFNFLIVSQLGPRKNYDNSIRWWVEEFVDQEVGLIVKTNIRSNSIIDKDVCEKRLSLMLRDYPDRKCKVYLLHGDLSSGQMTWLYNHEKVKALVNISHGEGFGLPLFEAAREALPVVTMAWSGQQDFLIKDKKEYFQKVKYSLSPVQKESHWEGVIQPDSMWAFADQGSYKMTLRKVLKKYTKCKDTAIELKKIIDENFSDERLYEIFTKSILEFFPNEDNDSWLAEIEDIVREYE